MVPQAAVIYGARGTTVYVVENGKAVVRPVKVVQPQGAEVAITGVEIGESVVLEGKQNLRPGSAVVERAKDPKDAAPGAAGAAAPANPVAGANPGASAAPGAADAGSRPRATP